VRATRGNSARIERPVTDARLPSGVDDPAFREYRAGVGQLHSQYADLLDDLNAGHTEVRNTLTRVRLAAIDRQSLVLLGDPTVTLLGAA